MFYAVYLNVLISSVEVAVFIYVFRSSKTQRLADIGAGDKSSPFLMLRAETTITSILNVIHLRT